MSASDKPRADDFSEKHLIPVDTAAAIDLLEKLQDNIYDRVNEPFQNAFDSNDRGKPNKIEVTIGKESDDFTLCVRDYGPEGITKYHNGNIDAFIEEMKATTQKILAGLPRKGIGMFQYPTIAPQVTIVSMDKEMIYRIPMYKIAGQQGTFYGKVLRKPIMATGRDYKKEFDIYEPGTRVTFFGRDKDAEKIDEKKLIEKTREKWALRLYDEKNVTVFINGKQILAPQWINDHPPRFIQRMSGGTSIRGNIWFDEKGNGSVKIFQHGYLVESYLPEPRQCLAYVEIDTLDTDPARKMFNKDTRQWKEFVGRIVQEVCKFPRVTPEEQDEKNVRTVRDLALKILKLPKAPTSFGSAPDLTKVEGTGDLTGDGIIGYKKRETPDPNREIKPRPGGVGKPHDMSNQKTIGDEGDDEVMRSGEDEKGPRKHNSGLEFLEYQHCGAKRPLFILFTDRKPYLLVENMDNPEHAIYEYLKQNPTVGVLRKMYNCKMADWFSEINMETDGIVDEPLRMHHSDYRVEAWKTSGYMPKAKAIAITERKKNDSSSSNVNGRNNSK